jgi:putative N6-adenine-specific DNA methylase
MDRAPGLGRAFSLEDMPFALGRGGSAAGPPAGPLAAEVEAAKARVRRDAEFRIVGSDADPRALEAAKANAARAGVAAGLEFRLAKAEDAKPEYEVGSLLCNPPYGERLGTIEDAEATYRALGETAERFSGWGLGFVTNRPDFGDYFGRYATVAHKVINGAEEQWFHWYPAGTEGESGRKPAETRRPEGGRLREPPRGADARSGGTSAPRAAWRGPDKPGWKSKKPPR